MSARHPAGLALVGLLIAAGVAVVVWVLVAPSLGRRAGESHNAEATPPPAPPPPPLPSLSVAQKVEIFLTFVSKHRAAPQQITEAEHECSPDGTCEAAFNVDPDVITYLVTRYFKAKPAAARFSIHFSGTMNCMMLGADHKLIWQERGRIAGGERCSYTAGPLKGLEVLIEKTRTPQGRLTPAVFVYSKEYFKLDRGFADGVRQDEANVNH